MGKMLRKILGYGLLSAFGVGLYLGGIALAVNLYEHNSKDYVPNVTAAQAFIKNVPQTPDPVLQYTPIMYPDVFYPGPSYDTPTPAPTMGVSPTYKPSAPAPKPTCKSKEHCK